MLSNISLLCCVSCPVCVRYIFIYMNTYTYIDINVHVYVYCYHCAMVSRYTIKYILLICRKKKRFRAGKEHCRVLSIHRFHKIFQEAKYSHLEPILAKKQKHFTGKINHLFTLNLKKLVTMTAALGNCFRTLKKGKWRKKLSKNSKLFLRTEKQAEADCWRHHEIIIIIQVSLNS